MEPHDLFSYQMHIRRPVPAEKFRILRVTQSCDIVCKRVKPYIDDVFRIDGHRNAPVKRTPGDAQVVQPLTYKAEHLISSGFRLKKIRMIFQKIDQTILIFGEAEEIRFLFRLFHRPAAVRTFAVRRLNLRPERFARSAVEPFILAFINISFFVHPAEDILYALHMSVLCGADKIIIGNFHRIP